MGTITVTATVGRGFAPSIEFKEVVTVLGLPLTVIFTSVVAWHRKTPEYWLLEKTLHEPAFIVVSDPL